MRILTNADIDSLLRQSSLSKKLQSESKLRHKITDWNDLDFVTIISRSNRGLFVIEREGIYIAPFSINTKLVDASGRAKPIICDICATWRHGSAASRISFESANKVTAWLCCADLLCNKNTRNTTEAVAISRTQLAESITPEAQLQRFHMRLDRLIETVPFQKANLTEKTPLQNTQNLLQ